MRIYPNKEQKALFEKCLGVHRYFYNKGNAYLKQAYGTEEFKECLSMISLRKKILKSDSELTDEEQWQKEVPYDTRQLALKQIVTSYKSSLALKRKGLIKSFDVAFLKKKSPRQIFYVDKRALKVINNEQLNIFTQRLKSKKKLRQRKRDRKKLSSFLEGKNDSDVVIQKLDCGKWYICLLKEK